jgi:hypothetical protein
LIKSEAEAKEIYEDMLYFKRRDERMEKTNNSTSSRASWLSLLSLSTVISVAAWQLFYLKRFFKQKKIL